MTEQAQAYPLPGAALDDRLGFLGTSGSGKTYGAGTAVERLLSNRSRAIISDPLGVWWGLRLRADSKPSNFDVVIFGGEHGDLPLNEHAGALIGETVAGIKESAIIDLSGLGTKAAERRFMLAFLTALYRHASGEPVHLIFDEADLWAPQQIRDRDQEPAKLLGMMETIVRRGRVKGFIPWLISQRPAVINKDVLSQVDGLVAFKLTSSQDRDQLGDWIKGQADVQQGKSILASLPTLTIGQAVVWVPGRGVLGTERFPEKVTFDSSRTPKRGEARQNVALNPIDLGALKDRLGAVEAEAKANDPKALKAEIARLTRELASRSSSSSDAAKRDTVEAERRAYERGELAGRKRAAEAIGRIAADLASSLGRAKTAAEDGERLLSSFATFMASQAEAMPVAMPAPQTNPKPSPVRQPDLTSDPFLNAALQVWPAKMTWAGLASMCGRKARGGSFNTRRRQLLDGGHVREEDDLVVPVNPPATPAGVIPADLLEANLPTTAADAFKIIRRNPGIRQDELAAMLGVVPRGGSWNTRMSILRRNGLITETDGLRIAEGLESTERARPS